MKVIAKIGGLLIAVALLGISVWLVNTLILQRAETLAQSLEKSKPAITAGIGESLVSGDVRVTVNKVDLSEKLNGFTYEHEENSHQWCIVAFSLENQGTQPVEFRLFEFALMPEERRMRYDIMTDATNFIAKKEIFDNTKQSEIFSLEPGQHWEMTLAFYVNKSEEKLYFNIPIQEFEGDNADTKKRILVIDSSQ